MGFEEKGEIVFRVARGGNSQWDVNENGFNEPLASFDSERDACSYANDLAQAMQGSAVVVAGDKIRRVSSLAAHTKR
jgi:Uncharacterized protein conserved in bacteria (DUF2188)